MDTHVLRRRQGALVYLLLSWLCTVGCTGWQADRDGPSATNIGVSFSRMSVDVQRIVLLQAVRTLDRDLGRMSNGPEWKTHLQLETIQELLNQPSNVPDKATRKRLNQIADLLNTVASNSDYGMIHELTSFRTLQLGLPEFAIDPVVRHSRNVAASLTLLTGELDGFSHSASWKSFLKLNELAELTRSPHALTSADRGVLVTILTQFESIKESPRYISVASGLGFKATLRGLEQLVHDLRTDTEQTVQFDSESSRNLDPRRYQVVELTNGDLVVIDRTSGNRLSRLRQPIESSRRIVNQQHPAGRSVDYPELNALAQPPIPKQRAWTELH